MKPILLAAVATVVAASPLANTGAFAQQPAVTMTTPASIYLESAASLSAFALQSSQLALQVSSNPAIRSFAQNIIDDHNQLTLELDAAARADGLQPPAPTLLPRHQQMLDQLRRAPAGQFDALYRQFQLAALEDEATLHRGFATSGSAARTQDIADRWWPCLQADREAVPTVYTGERG